jgi:hypothetical protein
LHNLSVICETNLLSLVNLWLNNNYQIQTKCYSAKFKKKTRKQGPCFYQYIWSMWISLRLFWFAHCLFPSRTTLTRQTVHPSSQATTVFMHHAISLLNTCMHASDSESHLTIFIHVRGKGCLTVTDRAYMHAWML